MVQYFTYLNTGITVAWDMGTSIYVVLDPEYMEQVCGLCGDFNGIGNDDFRTRQGELEASSSLFGHSWRTGESCPVPILNIHPCDLNPERRPWAEYSCGIVKDSIFAPCHDLVRLITQYC